MFFKKTAFLSVYMRFNWVFAFYVGLKKNSFGRHSETLIKQGKKKKFENN